MDWQKQLCELESQAAVFLQQRCPLSKARLPDAPLRVSSDCAGQGASAQALCHLGIQHAACMVTEKDRNTRFLLRKVHETLQLAKVEIVEDVRLHLARARQGDPALRGVDLHEAGYPCQAFSRMGSRLGARDERGFLWLNGMEILALTAPRCFLLEQVPALARDVEFAEIFRRSLKFLESSGFQVTWRIVNSLANGVPQDRERLYILGVRTDVVMHLCRSYSWYFQVLWRCLLLLLSFVSSPQNIRSSYWIRGLD